MDPRRKIDEKYERFERDRIPSFETYRETVLENQPFGPPIEQEMIVIRINKSALLLNSCLAAFALLIVALTIWQSGD